ncbi:MAG: hypothetical protein HZA34_03015 [Candidatus Pacebacteria bacterium]|nr:hypothetical protein [Candidatus Paceibacterota bacterium]
MAVAAETRTRRSPTKEYIQQRTGIPVPRFNLYHTLRGPIESLFQHYGNTPSFITKKRVRPHVSELLHKEYATYLQEEMRFRFYCNVVTPLWHTAQTLHIDDLVGVQYAHQGLMDQQRKAMMLAMKNHDLERAQRYAREAAQLKEVMTLMSSELSHTAPHMLIEHIAHTPPEGFISYSGSLPQDIRKTIPPHMRKEADRATSVGQKYIFAMPDHQVYHPDRESFLEAVQLAYNPYLPEGHQFFVFLHQYKAALPLSELSHLMEHASLHTSQPPLPQTEPELMQQILPVDFMFQHLDTQSFFTALLHKASLDSPQIQTILTEHQTAIARFNTREKRMRRVVETMTSVLIEEYLHHDAYSEAALSIANEVAMNGLGFDDGDFNSNAVWDAYKQFLHPKRRKTLASEKLPEVRETFLSHIIKKAPTMGSLQFDFLSVVDCAAGTPFGGIRTVLSQPSFASSLGIPDLQSFGTSDALLSFFRSQDFTQEQLRSFIGAHRFDTAWKFSDEGCKNPLCERKREKKHAGKHVGDWVGECGICYFCEAKDTLKSLVRHSEEKNASSEKPTSYTHDTEHLPSWLSIAYAGGMRFGVFEMTYSALVGSPARLVS